MNAALLALMILSAGATDDAKTRVLVLSLKPLSVPTDTTEIVDALVADALGKRTDIQVVSQAELKAMVELEQTKQAVGCDTSSCLGELAGAMGARYVVFGQLGTLGSSLVLTLNLYDSSKGQPVGREIVRAETADKLADQLPPVVEKLGSGIEKPVVVPTATTASPPVIEEPSPPTITTGEPPPPTAAPEKKGSWLSTVGWVTVGLGSAWTVFQAGWATWAEVTLRTPDASIDDKEAARNSGAYALLGAGAGVLIVGVGAGLLFIPTGD